MTVTRALSVALALVALCALTFSLAKAHAYRTAGDTPDFAGTERVRWNPGIVPFVLYNDAPDALPVSQVADTIDDAMKTWQEPICSGLEWGFNGLTELPARSGDHVNTIQWVNDWIDRGFKQNDAAVTDILYAQMEGEEWRIVEADIYLNAEQFSWNLRGEEAGGRSALSVLTHELGHALGLMHPCETGGDAATRTPDCRSRDDWNDTTLYPVYSPSQAVLAEDDEDGVCFLYPAETCEETGCSQGLVCTDIGCQLECGNTVCGTDEECVDDECLPRCRDAACQIGMECERSRDCHDSLSCRNDRCRPGDGAIGDPCEDSDECASYVCIKYGYCAPTCETDEDCPESGSKCRDGMGTIRACESTLEPLGEPCEEANECLGDQCLGGLGEPLCTRRCGEDYTECPDGWTCDEVEGRLVCTPPVDAGTGCTITRPSRLRRAPLALLPALALLLALTRRRTRHCATAKQRRQQKRAIHSAQVLAKRRCMQ